MLQAMLPFCWVGGEAKAFKEIFVDEPDPPTSTRAMSNPSREEPDIALTII